MADFKTHLTVAAGASGLLATLCLGAQLATPQQVLAFSALGTLGGILPDIDSDTSAPLKIIFTAVAGILAFLVMFSQAAAYSVLELWLVWAAVYFSIRYPMMQFFADFTIHRGIFHSLMAALFFWFFATTLSYYIFDLERGLSWWTGFFIFLGFCVHLTLDEIYSVDLLNKRLKKSFGTALKIVNFDDMKSSLVLTIVTLLVFLMTPSTDQFTRQLFSAETYQNLGHHFLPQGQWFYL